MGNPKQIAAKFQRLAQAIADAPDTRTRTQLSHEECQQLLEFYVDSEKRGENARRIYPTVFKHLTTCERCQIAYDVLTDAVSPAASRDFALPTERKADLSFLVGKIPQAALNKYIHSRIAGGRLGFGYAIDPKFVASALDSPAALEVRGETSSEGSLLLLDSVALGSRDLTVELRMRRLESDSVRLDISVVPSSPLPEPLRVDLYLDDKPYSASIEHDHGSTDEIPLANLANAQIRVEFEVGPAAPSSED